jgi:hypothetical protein
LYEGSQIEEDTETFSPVPIPETLNMSGAAQAPAGLAPAQPKTPKLLLPAAFTGNKGMAKLFKAQCEMYLTVKAADFPTYMSEVAFILGLMTGGEAKRWAETYYTTDHTAQTTGGLLGNKVYFWNLFESAFFPKHQRIAAVEALIKVKQTGGVGGYNSLFMKLYNDSEMTDMRAVMTFYQKGLKTNIAMDVLRLGTQPNSLTTLMDSALEVESRHNAVYGKGNYNAFGNTRSH